MIQNTGAWVVDTDVQIFRLGIDAGLRDAAKGKRADRAPVAVTAFSRLEFKGNYVKCLQLLRRKVQDSDDAMSVFARVESSGGRKALMMLRQLVKLLGGVVLLRAPWPKVQGKLVTLLDAEITTAWRWFTDSVDHFVDDLACDRAAEGPELIGAHWVTTIPECRGSNTTCRVVEFFRENDGALHKLAEGLSEAPAGSLSAELEKIAAVLRQTFVAGRFPWEGETCRSVGDLLIALQALPRRGLVTSNRAEHDTLARLLGYQVDFLSVAANRLK
jgi:hypothetical protein